MQYTCASPRPLTSSCPLFLGLLASVPGFLSPSPALSCSHLHSHACSTFTFVFTLLILVFPPLLLLPFCPCSLSLPFTVSLYLCYWVSGLFVLAVSGCCLDSPSVCVLLHLCDSWSTWLRSLSLGISVSLPGHKC